MSEKHPAAWSRPLRRIIRPFLNAAERSRIAALIAELEAKTTGEIHVHLTSSLKGKDPLEAARVKFSSLGLEKTAGRNGVLLLISHIDHRFAIWGDAGIHAKTGQRLWESAAQALLSHFKERRYPEGIEACLREIGRELAGHFPKNEAGPGRDELPNDVTQD